MRTVDATLLAALQAGEGQPHLKAYVGYTDGSVSFSSEAVRAYRLTGTELEFYIETIEGFVSDQEQIWLERGLVINGTSYTITTGRFFIVEEEYLPEQVTRFKGSLFPPQYYSDAGDTTYELAIDAFCTAFGKTDAYKDDTEAWLDYQFLPTGQNIIVNHAMKFLNMLHQKRLIGCCDNGSEAVRFYSADVIGTASATIDIVDEFALRTTKQRSRQFIWHDEAGTTHQDGTVTDPIHNLGYLESTDSCPARNTQTFEVDAYIRPDLRLQDGDTLTVRMYGATKTATFFAKVTEEWDSKSTKLPRWRVRLQSDPIFAETEGGAMPSTIERVANYTPLNVSNFDGILSDQDNNLQAALDTIDDHDHPAPGWTDLHCTSDVTVINSTTLTNDTELTISVLAGVYMMELYLIYTGNSGAADFKCCWALTGTGAPTFHGFHRQVGDSTIANAVLPTSETRETGATATTTKQIGTPGDASYRTYKWEAMFRFDAAGTWTFQFAEVTAGAGTQVQRLAGTLFRYRKIK